MVPTLREVATRLNLDLRDEGYQSCPFCHREKKFRVSAGQYYKCFHPACNKHGGVLDFIVDFGSAASRDEARKFIGGFKDSTQWLWRTQRLETVLYAYMEAINDQVLEFLDQRGYAHAIDGENPYAVEFGYAPHSRYLQENGFELEELIKIGLARPDGTEFFSNRVIFPVRDFKCRLVHMQGRSMDPDEDLRWLSSPSRLPDSTITPITNYLYNAHSFNEDESIDWLVMSEGVSDGLSLIGIDVPAVSCFGIQVNLLRFIEFFRKVNNLLVLFDNDRYAIGTEFAGQYKSWPPILKSLVELKAARPELNILCALPPEIPGIKDTNDWIKTGITNEAFTKYIRVESKPIGEFALEVLGPYWEHQSTLIELVNTDEGLIDQFKQTIHELEPDPVKYLLKVYSNIIG